MKLDPRDPCPVGYVSDGQFCERCGAAWDAGDWDGVCRRQVEPLRERSGFGALVRRLVRRVVKR